MAPLSSKQQPSIQDLASEREAGGLSDGGARWRVASKADVMKLDLHSRSL